MNIRKIGTFLAISTMVLGNYGPALAKESHSVVSAHAAVQISQNHKNENRGNKIADSKKEKGDDKSSNKDKDYDKNEQKNKLIENPCVINPAGHVRWGWFKNFFHWGVNKKCNNGDTTSTDVTAPIISNVSAVRTTSTRARIAWTTNEKSNSTVWYSMSSPVTASSSVANSGLFVKDHIVLLNGLTPSSTYYYIVGSMDAAGNKSTSTQLSFTTNGGTPTDTTAPVISSVTTTNITTSSAHITWNTNEAANSKTWISTVSPVTTSSTPSSNSTTLVLSHDLAISGLTTSTTYYYVVSSVDSSGNTSFSGQSSFTTLPPPDTTAPVIGSVGSTSTASSSVHVTWTTNELANSKVTYSTSTPVSSGTQATVTNSTLMTSHDILLTSLNTSTTYYFFVTSQDAAANTATSSDSSFTTTP